LAFETPHPLGISSDHPWGGYGNFLELHNLNELTFRLGCLEWYMNVNFCGQGMVPLSVPDWMSAPILLLATGVQLAKWQN